MSPESYDVVIVGGGPAGCAAALSLPPGTQGLLIDRARVGSERCCGGLLTSDAQAALGNLGLQVPDTVRVLPEPRSVRAYDLDSGLEQRYHRPYLNLDRAAFDAWLLSLARERVEVRHETRFVGCTTGANEILLRCGKQTDVIQTQVLVGADGANSTVRRHCLPQHPGPRAMVATQVTLPWLDGQGRHSEAHEVLFGQALTDFYAWAIPKGQSVVVGCAFEDAANARKRFDQVVAWYQDNLGLGNQVLTRSARSLSRPHSHRELASGDGGVLLVGEAAGLVSPSSGEGISFALLSGAAAGRAVGTAAPDTEYHRHFRPLALRVMAKLLKAAVIYSPRLRSWALRLPWAP